MKRINRLPILILILITLVTGCGRIPGHNFHGGSVQEAGEEKAICISTFIEEGNYQGICDLFAENVKKDNPELTTQAQELIDFLGGAYEIEKYMGAQFEEKGNPKSGYGKMYDAEFVIVAGGVEYRMSIQEYLECVDENDNGLRIVSIISKEESERRFEIADGRSLEGEGILIDDISIEETWTAYDSAKDKSLMQEDLQLRGSSVNIVLGDKFNFFSEPEEIVFESDGVKEFVSQDYEDFIVIEVFSGEIADKTKDGVEDLPSEVVAAGASVLENYKYHTNRGVFINDPRDKVILKYGEGQEEDNALIYCCEGEGYLKFLFDEQDNVSEIRIYRDMDLLQ